MRPNNSNTCLLKLDDMSLNTFMEIYIGNISEEITKNGEDVSSKLILVETNGTKPIISNTAISVRKSTIKIGWTPKKM